MGEDTAEGDVPSTVAQAAAGSATAAAVARLATTTEGRRVRAGDGALVGVMPWQPARGGRCGPRPIRTHECGSCIGWRRGPRRGLPGLRQRRRARQLHQRRGPPGRLAVGREPSGRCAQAHLGGRVLDRDGRRPAPTVLGSRVLPTARRLSDLAETLVQDADEAHLVPWPLAVPAGGDVRDLAGLDRPLRRPPGAGRRGVRPPAPGFLATRAVHAALLARPAAEATWRVPLGLAAAMPTGRRATSRTSAERGAGRVAAPCACGCLRRTMCPTCGTGWRRRPTLPASRRPRSRRRPPPVPRSGLGAGLEDLLLASAEEAARYDLVWSPLASPTLFERGYVIAAGVPATPTASASRSVVRWPAPRGRRDRRRARAPGGGPGPRRGRADRLGAWPATSTPARRSGPGADVPVPLASLVMLLRAVRPGAGPCRRLERCRPAAPRRPGRIPPRRGGLQPGSLDRVALVDTVYLWVALSDNVATDALFALVAPRRSPPGWSPWAAGPRRAAPDRRPVAHPGRGPARRPRPGPRPGCGRRHRGRRAPRPAARHVALRAPAPPARWWNCSRRRGLTTARWCPR